MSIFPKFSIQIVVFATLCILPLCALPFVELLADNAKPEKLKVLSIGLYTLAGIFFLLTVFSKYYDNLIETITEYLENNTSMKLNITEDMRKLEAYSCAFFLMVVAATTIIIIIFGKEARFLYREDGIAESLTSIFYLLSTVICLIIFWKARGYKYLRINLLILALLFFFVGMEEISWGQRVFNLMTPEVMKGINIQNEITLHNDLVDFTYDLPRINGCVMPAFHIPLNEQVWTAISTSVLRLAVPPHAISNRHVLSRGGSRLCHYRSAPWHTDAIAHFILRCYAERG